MAKGFQLKRGNPNVQYFPEHGTPGSFQAGDVVDLNGGKVRIAAADSQIVGVAGSDYSGTENTSIPVYLLDSDAIWVAWADTTTNQSHVGNDFGLNIAAGSCTVDLGDATTTSVRIIGVDERDAVGDTARVLVKFLDAVNQTEEAG